MDDYPEKLAPEFDKGGGVSTPFNEWWERVHGEFPFVPEDVAEQWLHRHWSHSPYSFLRSRSYRFELTEFDPSDILGIWNFNSDNGDSTKQTGLYRLSQRFWVRDFMVENKRFPKPIIVLDNQDQHILSLENRPDWLENKPLILVEGHRRYEVAVGMMQKDPLDNPQKMWLMKKCEENEG